MNDTPQKSFKDTLNLPTTDFPIRAQHEVEDALLLERWQQEDLYRKSFDVNSGNPKFILHDGPPYANGHIHLGSSYNKILKDIVCKSRRMMGFHVPVTPGWDCHGLPIELKVVQEKPGLERDALINACREYATSWIDIQRKEFKSLGVLMDWDRPYITMSKDYEAATVRAFGILVKQSFIDRKSKTVPWCSHCETVLASAEIEHKERKDPSLYVAFDLKPEDAKRLFNQEGRVSIAVWTTTPWTLPLNRAVLAKPGTTYQLLDLKDRAVLIGERCAPKLAGLLEREPLVLATFSSETLKGLKVFHPFINREVPLLFDESVGVDEGTAFVHCAPGCGPSDYEIGVKNGLEIYSPLSADGKYTDLIEPAELAGLAVTDGQGWVIKKLMELNTLLYKGSITHSYPHCWRCHNGLIFRATPQWFFNLETQGIKTRVLEAIETIEFIPPQASSFLKATVESRWEWCLSRQRAWGTPIPALLCTGCDYAYLDTDLIEKVAVGIEKGGIEYWARVRVDELTDKVCPQCTSTAFKKEQDILDVWFDSGISHYAVLAKNPELHFPADMYLEGTDQHRGWFQSSLITSMVIEGSPCTKTIMPHGYTVDAKGQKMSKSLGNVVSPAEIIKKLGTDGLRLWVASINHEHDAVVSEVLFKNVAEVHRKIRNTCRFLLSNLYDFQIERDRVQDLLPLDHYALTQIALLNDEIIEEYRASNFTAIFHTLAEYCSSDLSAFYLDIVKDRLYCEKADSHLRRSAQTALWYILDTLTRLMAPILSFTAEQVSDHYQVGKTTSIHLQTFADPVKFHALCFPTTKVWPDLEVRMGNLAVVRQDIEDKQREYAYMHQWETLKDIRAVLLKAIELEREKGLIKHSLEAHVTVFIDKEKYSSLQSLFDSIVRQGQTTENFLKEFLIVSQVTLAPTRDGLPHSSDEGIAVLITHADGVKCPRCWQWDVTTNKDNLSRRCERVLQSK